MTQITAAGGRAHWLSQAAHKEPQGCVVSRAISSSWPNTRRNNPLSFAKAQQRCHPHPVRMGAHSTPSANACGKPTSRAQDCKNYIGPNVVLKHDVQFTGDRRASRLSLVDTSWMKESARIGRRRLQPLVGWAKSPMHKVARLAGFTVGWLRRLPCELVFSWERKPPPSFMMMDRAPRLHPDGPQGNQSQIVRNVL